MVIDFKIDGEPVDILEEIETEKVSYDIVDGRFIATKYYKKHLEAKIYTYDTGISVCFKLDDSGENEFFEILFVNVAKQIEKNVLTVPRTASVEINKIDDEHFQIFMNDKQNNENTLTFVTVKNAESIQLCTLNATKIVQHDVVKNAFVLYSSYEQIDEQKFLYVVAVYDLSGVAIKNIIDKESNKQIVYKFGNLKEKKVDVCIEKRKGKLAKVGKFVFPEGYVISSDALPANENVDSQNTESTNQQPVETETESSDALQNSENDLQNDEADAENATENETLEENSEPKEENTEATEENATENTEETENVDSNEEDGNENLENAVESEENQVKEEDLNNQLEETNSENETSDSADTEEEQATENTDETENNNIKSETKQEQQPDDSNETTKDTVANENETLSSENQIENDNSENKESLQENDNQSENTAEAETPEVETADTAEIETENADVKNENNETKNNEKNIETG